MNSLALAKTAQFLKSLAMNESYKFDLRGIEKISYGQYQNLLDRLQAVGGALALYYIKDQSTPTPETQWLYDFTDGMTKEDVQQGADSVVNLINTLGDGTETPYAAVGTIKIDFWGATLRSGKMNYHFPWKDKKQNIKVRIAEPNGKDLVHPALQRSSAEIIDGDLELSILMDGGDFLFSSCTWYINRQTGTIRMALKEARHESFSGYGTALMNQITDAVGQIQRI